MIEPRLHVVLGTGPLELAVARHLFARDERLQVVNTTGRAELPPEVPVVAANIAEPDAFKDARELEDLHRVVALQTVDRHRK